MIDVYFENKYMKCVLQINGFSGPHPRVQFNRRVGSSPEAQKLRTRVLHVNYSYISELDVGF